MKGFPLFISKNESSQVCKMRKKGVQGDGNCSIKMVRCTDGDKKEIERA